MRNNKAVCFSGSRSMNTIFSLSRSGPGPIALQPTRQYPFFLGISQVVCSPCLFFLAACSGGSRWNSQ